MSVLINDGNAENEDIVKCDIGELVLSVELLKSQLSPFIRIFNNSRSILRFASCSVSFLTTSSACEQHCIKNKKFIVLYLLPLSLHYNIHGII